MPSFLTLPPGLDNALLRVLTDHCGRLHAISRVDLTLAVQDYHVTERQVRQQIKLLRRLGHLIGSAAGDDGGYFLIGSPAEFREFMASEYLGKIKDMSTTANAMSNAARHLWGDNALQLRLL